jgi:hypothetical protein
MMAGQECSLAWVKGFYDNHVFDGGYRRGEKICDVPIRVFSLQGFEAEMADNKVGFN